MRVVVRDRGVPPRAGAEESARRASHARVGPRDRRDPLGDPGAGVDPGAGGRGGEQPHPPPRPDVRGPAPWVLRVLRTARAPSRRPGGRDVRRGDRRRARRDHAAAERALRHHVRRVRADRGEHRSLHARDRPGLARATRRRRPSRTRDPPTLAGARGAEGRAAAALRRRGAAEPAPPRRAGVLVVHADRGPGGLMTSVIFGVRLDELASVENLRGIATGFLEGDRAFRIFTPNPEILLHAREDPAYADLLRSADLALPDGTGVAVVQALRSRRSVRRWPGVEIAAMLLRLAAERGDTVAFVGGSPDVAERAAARWRALPGLKVVVAGAGVAVDEDGVARSMAREDETVDVIRSAAPTIVLVGLGSPKQERWIERHADAFPTVRIMIGVGGAFDMWAGSKRRAPRALRTFGLEWLWRLALEPRRLPRVLRGTRP